MNDQASRHTNDSSLMCSSLYNLVAAIRGRDWYDEPKEREVFIKTIINEVTHQRASIDPLLSLLNDHDWAVVNEIIDMLAEIGDVRAVPALIEVMQELNVWAAVFALKRIGTPEALAAVREWYHSAEIEIEKLGIFIEIDPNDLALGNEQPLGGV